VVDTTVTERAGSGRFAAAYLGLIALAVVAFLGIRVWGEALVPVASVGDAPVKAAAARGDVLGSVLLALAVITVATQATGYAVRRWLRQPPVIGEILAGILLGPSLLGALWPAASAAVLPADAAPYVGIVAKIGVVLFMFLVGLEVDLGSLRREVRATLAISHASITVPFLLGTVLALGLYTRYAPGGVEFTVFALFVGVALSVTAFPVLARILTDRNVQGTPLGMMALACAAIDDVTAWTLLALVSGVASAQVSGVTWTLAWVVAYMALMIGVVRPLVTYLASIQNRLEGPVGRPVVAVVSVALLASALATEAIGIHALFGAFLLGVMLPHHGRLAHGLRQRFEDIVLVLFLPAFFAFTGMRTRIGLLEGGEDWLFCGLIIAVATLGKFGGSYAAARMNGLSPRTAGALGILMNTRGLMELIVLNVGLDLGILSPKLFAMFVIMAVTTTFATTPILDRLLGRAGFEGALQRA